MKNAGSHQIIIVNSKEFREAWHWLIDLLTTEKKLITQHNYYLDHKHWNYPNCLKCLDELEKSDLYLARLYLISEIALVSDYLQNLKTDIFNFELRYRSKILDKKIGRVIKSTVVNNKSSFRDSLAEHIAFWMIIASVVKNDEFLDFSIHKPNIQSEDKGLDGLACVLKKDNSLTIKIISVKNSINSPKDLISSSNFRKGNFNSLDDGKLLDEFFGIEKENTGFQNLDEKLYFLLQEVKQDCDNESRLLYIRSGSEFNASVVCNEIHVGEDLYEGFNYISDSSDKRIGLIIGSHDWIDFSSKVQEKIKKILNLKGMTF